MRWNLAVPSAGDIGMAQFSGALPDGFPIDELAEDRPLARDGGDIHPERAHKARKERNDQQATGDLRPHETDEKRRGQGQPQGDAQAPRCQAPALRRWVLADQQTLQREDHLAFSFLMIHGCPMCDTNRRFEAEMK